MHCPTSRRGFSLIELVCVLAVAALLATLTLPTFAGALQRARRSDAISALLQIELAQQRVRNDAPAYAATLDELKLAGRSLLGHYRLQLTGGDADGFEASAEGVGAQAADTGCRWLKVIVDGSQTSYASGPDATTSNPPAQNRRCWNQP